MTTIRALALLLLLSGCGAATSGGGSRLPVPVVDLRPDDRLVLREMRTIQAVAASFERMYAVYPSAVGMWSQGAQRWTGLFDAPEESALQRVFQALIDPLDQSLWMIDPTTLFHIDPFLDRWERRALPATARGLGVDPAQPGGILVETGVGWFFLGQSGDLRRTSPGPALKRAATLDDAYAAMPQLQSMAAIIARGPQFTSGRLTAAARDPLTAGWFVGTDRRGLLRFPIGGGITPVPVRQGVSGEVVGGLAATPGGLWVASWSPGRIGSLSIELLNADLAQSREITGDPVFGMGATVVSRIFAEQGRLWLSTDGGVVEISLGDERVTRWRATDGLTDDQVRDIVAWQGGVAVGMERGLVFIDSTGRVSRLPVPVLDGIYDLEVSGDTLWAATTRGLGRMVQGDSMLQLDRDAVLDPASGIDRVAVATSGDTLLALSSRRLLWRDPITRGWTAGPDLTSAAGRLRLMHVMPGGIWVAGDRGAVLVQAGTGVLAALRVGADLPALPLSLATDEEYLWVGTGAGLVRIRLAR